jgi:uncharacterized protein (DUF4415 family)
VSIISVIRVFCGCSLCWLGNKNTATAATPWFKRNVCFSFLSKYDIIICNYIWSYNSVKFQWDEEKNEQNIRKHGFDFADMRKQSRTNWTRIDAMKDDEIDYSDNPELGDDFFVEAVPWPRHKQQITLRLDPDVIDFFKRRGEGYQTMMNAVLRKYVQAQTKQK